MAKVTQKTLDANGSVSFDVPGPHNVVVEGTFGGGTITHTMSGTSTAVRTPATAAEAYRNEVQRNTFTLTGATAPSITITIEE